MVACTYKDGIGVTIYLNGVKNATTVGTGNIDDSPGEDFYISSRYGTEAFFTGMIDEVRIYNESLSESQIYQYYIDTKDGKSSNSTIVSNETIDADEWKCEVTPNDAILDGTAKNSSSLIIGASQNDPTIEFVETIPLQSVTEGNATNVTFSFIATDLDLVSNLNDSSAKATFNRTGETSRHNTTCTVVDLNTTSANYTCAIDMWYWDSNGDWTINVSVGDITGAHAYDNSSTFQLDLTTAMVISPSSLSWGTLSLTSINQLANENITINNTANKDITDGNLNVTAIDLQGVSDDTYTLLAGNFSIATTYACGVGSVMLNDTTLKISGATIPKGNNSEGNGQEQIFFCLEEISYGISLQTYDTTGGSSGAWTIGVI